MLCTQRIISVVKDKLNTLERLDKDLKALYFYSTNIMIMVYTRKKVWNSKLLGIPKQMPTSKDWKINEH